MTYKSDGRLVDCLPSICFVSAEAAADFAAALNLGSLHRNGGQDPKLDSNVREINKGEESNEAVSPIDLICVCSHERYYHGNNGACTIRKCKCQCFSESPTQPSPSPAPAAPAPAHVLSDSERQELNEQSLVLPLPPAPELALELAHALNALLSFGKQGKLAPKGVGLAGYVAIQRFCKEYQSEH